MELVLLYAALVGIACHLRVCSGLRDVVLGGVVKWYVDLVYYLEIDNKY